jgi:hypothetical protein
LWDARARLTGFGSVRERFEPAVVLVVPEDLPLVGLEFVPDDDGFPDVVGVDWEGALDCAGASGWDPGVPPSFPLAGTLGVAGGDEAVSFPFPRVITKRPRTSTTPTIAISTGRGSVPITRRP